MAIDLSWYIEFDTHLQDETDFETSDRPLMADRCYPTSAIPACNTSLAHLRGFKTPNDCTVSEMYYVSVF